MTSVRLDPTCPNFQVRLYRIISSGDTLAHFFAVIAILKVRQEIVHIWLNTTIDGEPAVDTAKPFGCCVIPTGSRDYGSE